MSAPTPEGIDRLAGLLVEQAEDELAKVNAELRTMRVRAAMRGRQEIADSPRYLELLSEHARLRVEIQRLGGRAAS
jgi:hypothetical protein